MPGIEITAVHDGRDVHVLGYFIEREDAALAEFLERQRADRVRRVGAMADKLADLGKPVDRDALLAARPGGKSLGRPLVAQALVKAGHVADTRQAFDQLIGEGKPAFVPRCGPSPADVIGIINRAGGIASLAHPGLLKRDDLIPGMIERRPDGRRSVPQRARCGDDRALSGVCRPSRHSGIGRVRLPRR